MLRHIPGPQFVNKCLQLLTGAFIITLFANCGGSDTKRADQEDKALKADTVAMPNFDATDSIELHYTPDADQQKTYFFETSSDPDLVAAIVRDLNGVPISGSPCTHYKKAYLFEQETVYKTVYISDSCNYLAFVVNGIQQYRSLSETARSKLNEVYSRLQKKAGAK